jgi:hypothetical protein
MIKWRFDKKNSLIVLNNLRKIEIENKIPLKERESYKIFKFVKDCLANENNQKRVKYWSILANRTPIDIPNTEWKIKCSIYFLLKSILVIELFKDGNNNQQQLQKTKESETLTPQQMEREIRDMLRDDCEEVGFYYSNSMFKEYLEDFFNNNIKHFYDTMLEGNLFLR